MKKILLLFAAFLLVAYSTSAQEKQKATNQKRRPVTEKSPAMTVHPDAKPSEEGQRNKEKIEEDIKKRRAEKRVKMEQARKEVREKIAADTTAK